MLVPENILIKAEYFLSKTESLGFSMFQTTGADLKIYFTINKIIFFQHTIIHFSPAYSEENNLLGFPINWTGKLTVPLHVISTKKSGTNGLAPQASGW